MKDWVGKSTWFGDRRGKRYKSLSGALEDKCSVGVGAAVWKETWVRKKASFKHIMRASPCIVSGCSCVFWEGTSARTFPLTKIKCLHSDQPLIHTGRHFPALWEAKAGCEFEHCRKQCGAKEKKKKSCVVEYLHCPVLRIKTLILSWHRLCLTSHPSKD